MNTMTTIISDNEFKIIEVFNTQIKVIRIKTNFIIKIFKKKIEYKNHL
jgi:hypothetical protein